MSTPVAPAARSRSSGSRCALLLCAAALAACDAGLTAPVEEGPTYQIVEGACGHVVFAERLALDSASAFQAVEARKIATFGAGRVTLAAFRLQVVDAQGSPPEARFYGIRVLEPGTGIHLHSVHEVITTRGDLFTLDWCPD